VALVCRWGSQMRLSSSFFGLSVWAMLLASGLVGCAGATVGKADASSSGGNTGRSGDSGGDRADGAAGSSSSTGGESLEGSGGVAGSSAGAAGGATGGISGAAGSRATGGDGGRGGVGGMGAGAGRGGAGAGGATATAGASGANGAGGKKGSAGSNGCNLPATVSFQKDVLPFLMKSCGSSGSDGCHVIDGASTMAQGGFDHGYDWITAGAHASSCPEKPTPERFQVVIAVIDGANPPTCSKSREMPPTNVTGTALRAPLTTCAVATLQAWLDEPLVTQMHRADDSSPTTPYPMPPFN
jgi:hypothetical protein